MKGLRLCCLALSCCLLSCGNGQESVDGGGKEQETAPCPKIVVSPPQTLSPIMGVWDDELAEGYWVSSQVVPPSLPNLVEWEIQRFCLRTPTNRIRGLGSIEFFTLTNEATLRLEVRGRHRSHETFTWKGPLEQLFPPVLRDVALGGEITIDVGD